MPFIEAFYVVHQGPRERLCPFRWSRKLRFREGNLPVHSLSVGLEPTVHTLWFLFSPFLAEVPVAGPVGQAGMVGW